MMHSMFWQQVANGLDLVARFPHVNSWRRLSKDRSELPLDYELHINVMTSPS